MTALFLIWLAFADTELGDSVGRNVSNWREPLDLLSVPWVGFAAMLFAFDVTVNATGRSPAKAALRIRVIDEDEGSVPGLGSALVRSVFSATVLIVFFFSILVLREHYRWYYATHDDATFAGVWLVPLYLGVACIWLLDPFVAIMGPDQKALHDRLAGTSVVKA